MSRYLTAEITGNQAVGAHYRLLSLKCPEAARRPKPGQFYMVQVRDSSDPLLKRPFSLFRMTEEGIQLLYRVQGRGTTLLAGLSAGAALQLLGPLGTGYPLPKGSTDAGSMQGAAPVIIAGGIGIASVYSLIEEMPGKATVFYGARTRDELLLLAELKGLAHDLHTCTDDGSHGEKGNVVDLLQQVLPAEIKPAPVLYACGPKPMLRAVAGFAGSRSLTAYLSLEEHMACGIGACLGCVTRIKNKALPQSGAAVSSGTYQRICMEGPVFKAEDIIW